MDEQTKSVRDLRFKQGQTGKKNEHSQYYFTEKKNVRAWSIMPKIRERILYQHRNVYNIWKE